MANKKYKLSNSDYWETSGVYDITEGKTQREINAAKVPTSRTVNGKALSADITLGSADIGDNSTAGGSTVKESLENLKGSLNTLETDVGGTVAIGTEAGLIRKSCFFKATANIPLGSTGVTLEAYARGAIFSNEGYTGSIVAIGYGGLAYCAFFADGAIQNARIVDMGRIAPVIKTLIAGKTLTPYDYRIYNNILYRITNTIPANSAINSTNAIETSVANELKRLSALQTITLTPNDTNVSWIEYACQRIGNIVFFSCTVVLNADIATGDVILSGLPSPTGVVTLTGTVIENPNDTAARGKAGRYRIGTNGTLIPWYNTWGAHVSGSTIFFSTVYFVNQ